MSNFVKMPQRHRINIQQMEAQKINRAVSENKVLQEKQHL